MSLLVFIFCRTLFGAKPHTRDRREMGPSLSFSFALLCDVKRLRRAHNFDQFCVTSFSESISLHRRILFGIIAGCFSNETRSCSVANSEFFPPFIFFFSIFPSIACARPFFVWKNENMTFKDIIEVLVAESEIAFFRERQNNTISYC